MNLHEKVGMLTQVIEESGVDFWTIRLQENPSKGGEPVVGVCLLKAIVPVPTRPEVKHLSSSFYFEQSDELEEAIARLYDMLRDLEELREENGFEFLSSKEDRSNKRLPWPDDSSEFI